MIYENLHLNFKVDRGTFGLESTVNKYEWAHLDIGRLFGIFRLRYSDINKNVTDDRIAIFRHLRSSVLSSSSVHREIYTENTNL